MKVTKEMTRLYLVTDRRYDKSKSLEDQVTEAILGGVSMVQLREKEIAEDEFLNMALKLKEICHRFQVPLILNDRVGLVLSSGADGVHIGQSDLPAVTVRKEIGPDKILGVTVKTVSQAILAFEAGADYVGCGAAFTTNTKGDATVLDHQVIREICEAIPIPVVVIGGITNENVTELLSYPIGGIAVCGGILAGKNPRKAALDFIKKMK